MLVSNTLIHVTKEYCSLIINDDSLISDNIWTHFRKDIGCNSETSSLAEVDLPDASCTMIVVSKMMLGIACWQLKVPDCSLKLNLRCMYLNLLFQC